MRNAGAVADLPRRVGPGSGLTPVPDHDFVDVGGGDARALDRRASRNSAELGRMQSLNDPP